ncbi:MAG: hypothetical protein J0G96_09900 [Flavobacteriia bacterium]|mgnify:CR=1 FL=1|nr:hypothetical protein [Flavobacteriia bacterium]OJX36604.1 MAG: hypothetical protein BGO87_12440 [Flavobacteriia bacterium 40-80]
MMTTSEIAKVYDTILSIPSMEETVKIDLRISRKNVLLLSSVIDRGLTAKDDGKEGGLLANVAKETLSALKGISEECLQKAGLTELNDKLIELSGTK